MDLATALAIIAVVLLLVFAGPWGGCLLVLIVGTVLLIYTFFWYVYVLVFTIALIVFIGTMARRGNG